MKKIAVNTRLLLKDEMDGIGVFTLETFKLLVSNHPEIEFTFIFDRKPHPDFIFSDNVKYKVISFPIKHPYLNVFWSKYFLKHLLKKLNPDLFVGTDGIIPLTTSVKTLTIIHDLNFEAHPDMLPKFVSKFYRTYFPKFAKEANRIATVSEYSKQDIVKNYGIASEKIDVVYNGANTNFRPIPEEEKRSIRKKHTSEKPYFLFVGTLHPRKNVVNLLKAFDQFKEETKSDMQLLMVGKKMWSTKDIWHQYHKLSYREDINFAGRLPDEELYKILASAQALTYVPFFEGFGIPLVEAMYCEIPIITSNVTSMPEIVGDAAILVDPSSVESICEAMVRIYSDKSLSSKLIEKGKKRRENFSWPNTEKLLWDSIQKTVTN